MSNKNSNFDRITLLDNIIKNIDIKNLYNIVDNNIIEKIKHNNDIREVINKKYIDIGLVLNEIGKAKLMYFKSGSTGHTFKCVKENNNKDFYAVKIVAYPKKMYYGDMYDTKRPENSEILMIMLLSEFVLKKKNPHIILPIITFNTSIKPFINFNSLNNISNKNFDKFVERYNNNDYYNNVSVLISEWANKSDLLEYLRKHYKEIPLLKWKILFFQLLSILAVIQHKYPCFKHNDMKSNNILVTTFNVNKKYYLYIVNRQKYVVPCIDIELRLWDFDFACIKNIIENSKVNTKWANNINITSIENKYYDIHYFFNTLIKKGFLPDIMINENVPLEVKSFINRVVPDKYKTGKYVTDRGRILINDEYTTPDILLKNDIFFEELRKN